MMEWNEQGPGLPESELSRVGEAFFTALAAKFKEKYGTDTGKSYRLNGRPLVARIAFTEPDGGILPPDKQEQVRIMAAEILTTYDLESVGLVATYEMDGDFVPTIVIRNKADSEE